MRSEAARRTRKELTFIPVAKCRTRRRRRSIDWSIDIVGETTGASNTPGCSTATLFSSSAHPLVGLIKKPCEGERERRRTRSEYSERGEEEAYRRLTGPRRGQGSGRGTRAQRGGASRTTSSRSFLLFRGFGRGNERRTRERGRERSVVSERRDGGPRVRERSLTSDEYVLISREGRALQEEEVRTAQVLRHGREAPRSQSQVAAQPLP